MGIVLVLVRLFDQEQAIEGVPSLPYRNHQRQAKKRMRAICYTRGQDKKVALYQNLIWVTQASLAYIDPVYQALAASSVDPAHCALWLAEVNHYRGLIKRVIDQTERQRLQG